MVISCIVSSFFLFFFGLSLLPLPWQRSSTSISRMVPSVPFVAAFSGPQTIPASLNHRLSRGKETHQKQQQLPLCQSLRQQQDEETFPEQQQKPKESVSFEVRSFPPPRFDEFGESLVGSWIVADLVADANGANGGASAGNGLDTAVVVVADVEEVMRSCGGAVQGIREPATVGNDKNNEGSSSSTYLNRANDGFVFFGDGSYTMGPTIVSNSDSNSNNFGGDDDGFLSCLVLPSVADESDGGKPRPRQRIVLSSVSSGGPDKTSHKATMRTKPPFIAQGDNSNEESSPLPLPLPSRSMIPAVEKITRVVRCRMPSQTQPWMLQRAKWETLIPVGGDDGTTSGGKNDINQQQQRYHHRWMISEPAAEFGERFGTTKALDDVASTTSDGSGVDGITVVHSGATCPHTKTVRVLARLYRCKEPNGSSTAADLCGILWIEGTMHFG